MLNKLPDAWIGHIAGCLLGKPVPIDTYIDQFTYQFITDQGVVSIQSGKIRECTLYSEKYVRIEVMAENGAMLFTQPIYQEELFRRP